MRAALLVSLLSSVGGPSDSVYLVQSCPFFDFPYNFIHPRMVSAFPVLFLFLYFGAIKPAVTVSQEYVGIYFGSLVPYLR